MRILSLAALACAALAVALCPARASGAIQSGAVASGDGTEYFTFAGTAGGATGSALLSINVTSAGGATTVVANIWNTSPTTYLDGNSQIQTNVAAITGFGFDVTPDLAFSTYSIVARQWNGTSFSNLTLADTDPAGNLWTLIENGGSGNINLDLFADNGGGIAEALYNPLLAGDGALGNTDPYFTEATLTITFASPDVAVQWAFSEQPGIVGNGGYVTPFVRMQRVGAGGSLRLEAEDPLEDRLLDALPEPVSVVSWLLGTASLGLVLRRSRNGAA